MKKLIVPFLVLILMGSIVLAGCPCNDKEETETLALETRQGSANKTGEINGQVEENGQETGEPLIKQANQLRVETASELREMVQERNQEMINEINASRGVLKNVYQNQNRVRLAVHTLLAAENLTGGIGRNISQIAREFNNSVQATIRAEERIETRNMLLRFFLGGDEGAAQEMEQEVNQNRVRIQQLKQLMEECDCDDEVKAMLQEQIQNMEQEQNRLQELAQNEKQSKGIFGWLWKK